MISAHEIRRNLASSRRIVSRLLSSWKLPAIIAFALAPAARPQALPYQSSVAPRVIVVGFVGGFVRNDDDRHPEVQIARRLSEEGLADVRAAAFENRNWSEARKEILRWLDTDGDGRLSAEEKRDSHIILFGHSWGGSAAIRLARDLNRRGIPVAMTIQVDSVNKGWGNDCVIPPNVDQALNFYQTRGLAHGCQTIRAVDSNRTRILGSYRFDYTSQPAECRSYSWVNRHFLKSHEAIDCDPRVWSQIDEQIRAQVERIVQAPQIESAAELPASGIEASIDREP
jgi:pimeloyl-ACP methyl ester carboxylesterase